MLADWPCKIRGSLPATQLHRISVYFRTIYDSMQNPGASLGLMFIFRWSLIYDPMIISIEGGEGRVFQWWTHCVLNVNLMTQKQRSIWERLRRHQNKRRTYKTILICNWHFELNLQLPFNIESWLVSRKYSIEKETKNPEAKMGLTSDLKIFSFNELSRQAMIKFSWHFLQFNEGSFIETFQCNEGMNFK